MIKCTIRFADPKLAYRFKACTDASFSRMVDGKLVAWELVDGYSVCCIRPIICDNYASIDLLRVGAKNINMKDYKALSQGTEIPLA